VLNYYITFREKIKYFFIFLRPIYESEETNSAAMGKLFKKYKNFGPYLARKICFGENRKLTQLWLNGIITSRNTNKIEDFGCSGEHCIAGSAGLAPSPA